MASIAVGLTVLASAGWILWTRATSEPSRFDDAYVFLRYAINYLDGYGHSWNREHGPVYGTTSILHFFVVTAARATMSHSNAQVIAVASLIAALLGIVILAAACAVPPERGRLTHFGVWLSIISICTCFTTTFQFHALTGMDTMLSFLSISLLCAAVASYWRAPRRRLILFMLATGYLAYLARPDNGIYALGVPLLAIWTRSQGSFRDSLLFVLLFFGVIAADTAVKYLTLGDPLPLAFYVKSQGFYESYGGAAKWNPFAYLFEFAVVNSPFLFGLALLVNRTNMRAVAALLLPVAMTFLYFFSVVQIMGYHARFYFPATPLLVFACASCIAGDRSSLQIQKIVAEWRWRLLASGAVLVLVLALIPLRHVHTSLIGRRVLQEPASNFSVNAEEPLPRLGKWKTLPVLVDILRDAPPGVTIAASEHGYLGSEFPSVTIYDLVSLHDRDWARHGFDVDDLLGRAPDIIWGPHEDYVGLVREIRSADRFWQEYVFLPGAFDDGIAIRRTSPLFDDLWPLVVRGWKRLYPETAIEDFAARRIEADRIEAY